jgi:hypothetical protein
MATRQLVIGDVVSQYTLIDELLGEIICRYFFKTKQDHFGRLWRTEKFRIFAHHILDEMYLLKKMALVHAIKPLPSEVTKRLQKINAVRNALAHSFFPREP